MIGVRVSEEEKERYEEYLETDAGMEFTSVASMMRTLANREVSGSNDTGAEIDQDAIRAVVEDALSDVEIKLGTMQTTMQTIEDSVTDDDDIQSLAAELYERIPPRDYEPNFGSHADGFAEGLDEPKGKVQRALSLCESQYPDIISEEGENGKRYYYRKEGI